jgi:hypothetical protein
VVLSRYEGERKVASLPYVLLMDENRRGTMRMGVQVAVPQGSGSAGMTYKDLGTTIICTARPLENGRFLLEVMISESSVLPDRGAETSAADSGAPMFRMPGGFPIFPTVDLTGALVLASGETAELGMATNPVTGQVTKVDVTLTVLK